MMDCNHLTCVSESLTGGAGISAKALWKPPGILRNDIKWVKNGKIGVKSETLLQIKDTELSDLVVSAYEEVSAAVVGVEVGIDRSAELGLLAVPRHSGHRPSLVIQEGLEIYIQLKCQK